MSSPAITIDVIENDTSSSVILFPIGQPYHHFGDELNFGTSQLLKSPSNTHPLQQNYFVTQSRLPEKLQT